MKTVDHKEKKTEVAQVPISGKRLAGQKLLLKQGISDS